MPTNIPESSADAPSATRSVRDLEGTLQLSAAGRPMPPLKWRLVGPDDAPVIGILGGISANRHGVDAGPTKGWWRGFCGPEKALDTTRIRLLSFDWLAPLDLEDDMPPDIASVPRQAEVLKHAMDAAGIERLGALLGSSFGGQVALVFASLFPDHVGRLVIIGAAHRNHPMATGWRETQRQIVLLGLRGGLGSEGLAVARQLAMTTYRSVEEFGQRFTAEPRVEDGWIRWDVSDYLVSRGEEFARTQTPGRYLALSLAIDLHRVDPAQITVPTDLYACQQDRLVPIEVMEELRERLGGPVRWHAFPSIYGHDAFLKETSVFNPAFDRLVMDVLEEARP